MKKVLLVLIATILGGYLFANVTLAANQKTYGEALYDLGIIKGDNGDLKEADYISREELVTILVRLSKDAEDENFIPPATPTFSDVPTNHWAYKNIELAYHKGLTKGDGSGKFGLGDLVIYDQASLFFLRSLGYNTKEIEYRKASKEISQKYNLDIKNAKKGTNCLRRIDIFELLSKTLLMKTANNKEKIETLNYDTEKVKEFKNQLKNVKLYDEFHSTYEWLTDEIRVHRMPTITPVQFQEMEKDKSVKEAYEISKTEIAGVKQFVKTYLQSDYKTLPIDIAPTLFKKDKPTFYSYGMYIDKSNNIVDYQPDIVEVSSTIWDDERKPIRFGTFVQGAGGTASTDGFATEVREYQSVNGLKVYMVLGTEESKIYKGNGQFFNHNEFGFVAFTVDENGQYQECIGDTVYGVGYGKREEKMEF